MLAFIDKYKKYLIGIALAAAIMLGFHLYVDKKETAAYAQGFEAANVQWEKKGKEYVDLIDKGKAENKALNEKLAIASEAKRRAEEKRVNDVKDKQVKYNKTEAAGKKGIDDDLVDIYNQSLGE